MASGQHIRLVHDGVRGVEAIYARFAAHAYDVHRHDDWLVGVTESGVQDFLCRGVRHRSTPGRVILIEPQEAHDGQAGSAEGFSYHMLYLPRPWLRATLADSPEGDGGFSATLSDDPRLGIAIRRACAILAEPDPDLLRTAALDRVMDLLRPHLGRPPRPRTGGRDIRVARRARALLHDAMTDDIGADALADAAGAGDRFHLARAFRAAYGTAPHAYLVQIRLLAARQKLAQGENPAAVAASCGFADQSHLGRWFRRAYGITPAAYRACCTGVPDGVRHAR
ncbi:MAG: AraC family transcriptional regulator [Azospirillaceae bacterium]|nr:AraC family transcriptional regulator [Azospirillaceae bacterium]